MTSDAVKPPVKPGMVGMTAIIGTFGALGTLFTDWIGLSPYPMPVFLSIIAVAVLLQRKSDEHLSWQHWAMVWGGAALLSIATAIMMSSNVTEPEPIGVALDAPGQPARTASPTKPVEPGILPPVIKSSASAGPTATSIVRTSIDELLDAYAANQIAASKKFGNSSIALTGRVVRVRESLGTGILVLRSTASGREQEFGFSDIGTEKLASVNSGDVVSITCPTVIEALSIVVVGGCSEIELK